MKLPTFFFDLAILKCFLLQFPDKKKQTLIYYFSSPIIVYACYAHSQLDLIPTGFLFASTFFLIRKRFQLSAILLGAAISTKAHTLMAFPFILVYIYKNNRMGKVIQYALMTASIVILFCFPFILSEGFQFFILRNKEKNLMFDVFHSIGDLKIYLSPLAIIILFMRFIVYKKINKDLFISFLGIVFSIFVLLVVPTPGWYVWGLPFLVYFFILNNNKKSEIVIFYSLLVTSYILYFTIFYKHPLQNLENLLFLGRKIIHVYDGLITFKNMSFTTLEAFLSITIYYVYCYGVRSNSVYKGRKYATLIGVGGDSGAGKTTLLKFLEKLFGEDCVVVLEGDAEHKWERGHENWQKFTHLNPKANFLHRQISHLEQLKTGKNTFRGDYDHNSGKFTKEKKISSNKFIIISGLHPFYLPKSRRLIDLKIFLDTDEKLRKHWKLLRDSSKRGHSIEKILEQIELRMEDAKKYIHPQKKFADLVFKYYTDDEFALGNRDANFKIKLMIVCNANLNLDTFLEDASTISSLSINHDYTSGLKKQILQINGKISNESLASISLKIIPNQEDFLTEKIQWKDDLEGIIQFFVLIALSEIYKEEGDEV